MVDAFLIGKKGLEFQDKEPAFLQYIKEMAQETQKNPSGVNMEELQKAFREGRFFGW